VDKIAIIKITIINSIKVKLLLGIAIL